VIIGPYFSAHSQEHHFEDRKLPIRDQGTVEREIVVGDDCWIGSKVTLLSGTSIGSHTVIAAGAVVKGEFPSHVVLGGVPARILRRI
jgi:acetyltransferase-like isoleucine patch superfamily enzyme